MDNKNPHLEKVFKNFLGDEKAPQELDNEIKNSLELIYLAESFLDLFIEKNMLTHLSLLENFSKSDFSDPK